ncbi:MAG: alpha-amylase [Cyanobacteria bacterium CRU_2_1]|nr:alpha-amylase [Cyanobacteria bacterium RU_5_0]NJR61728.1 alpha-amylase [Cyanobacteria bacterium CRU_2_1]
MEIHTPDWVKHAVFYQIFPDRFARGSQSPAPLDNLPLEEWDALPTSHGYKGGNLWGVIERLDYLQDLGFNAIYFTPIFQSASNHRYHTHDYYQVDPLLGGNGALYRLLEAAHYRGMKVLLDGVFNHASRGFFYFNDILENGPHSPWLDWFKIEEWPLSAYDGERLANYIGWAGNRALPEFNHANPAVREYIMQVGEFWIRQGIDGWRLDVPFCVKEPGFWQEFRDRIKAINPQAYIVGEVWRDARQWLDGTQFDGVLNYLFTGATIALTAGDRVIPEIVGDRSYDPYPAIDAVEYAEKIQLLLHAYPWEIQLTQLNLLASHDTARLLTIAGDDISSVKLANLLLFTFPGAPSVYYGDEVGLPGANDPDCRRGFPAKEQWNLELLTCHRQLIALRHSHMALRIGEYRLLGAEGMVYVFTRIWEGDVLIIAINPGTELAKIDLESVGTRLHSQPSYILYATSEEAPEMTTVLWTADNLFLALPPRTGIVLG